MAACCDAQVSGGEKEEGSRRELGSPMWLANLIMLKKRVAGRAWSRGRRGGAQWYSFGQGRDTRRRSPPLPLCSAHPIPPCRHPVSSRHLEHPTHKILQDQWLPGLLQVRPSACSGPHSAPSAALCTLPTLYEACCSFPLLRASLCSLVSVHHSRPTPSHLYPSTAPLNCLLPVDLKILGSN